MRNVSVFKKRFMLITMLVVMVSVLGITSLPVSAAKDKITFTDDGHVVHVGDELFIYLNNNGDSLDGVKYLSSNKRVATVSSYGEVHGKKPGKVKITATYNGKKYKYTVKVIKALGVKLKTMSVKKGKKKLTYTLKNMTNKKVVIYTETTFMDYDCGYSYGKIIGKKSVTINPWGTATFSLTEKVITDYFDPLGVRVSIKWNGKKVIYDIGIKAGMGSISSYGWLKHKL